MGGSLKSRVPNFHGETSGPVPLPVWGVGRGEAGGGVGRVETGEMAGPAPEGGAGESAARVKPRRLRKQRRRVKDRIDGKAVEADRAVD